MQAELRAVESDL